MNRNTIIQSIAFVIAIHSTCTAQEPHVGTLADQPVAQQTAVREILKLGGDWEAGSKTVLIGFIGDKFTKEKFKLLTPLVDVRILYFQDLSVGDSALVHCDKLKRIEYLQIVSCKYTGVGLKHFSESKSLKRLFIEDTPITDDGLEEIANLKNLEFISIDNYHVPSKLTEGGIRKLTSLKQLKQLDITMVQVPEGFEEEVQKLMPDCEVHLGQFKPVR